jgi:hypothetical protein
MYGLHRHKKLLNRNSRSSRLLFFFLITIFLSLANSLSPALNLACMQQNYSSELLVNLSNSVYDGCTSTTAGGAIYVGNGSTIFILLNCEFIRCHSSRQGGCIFFNGSSASVFGFRGINCSTVSNAAFLYLQANSSATGSILLNESTGFHGTSRSWSFHAVFLPDPASPGCFGIAILLNSSFNFADSVSSALDLGEHYSFSISLCRFHSNSPRNTFLIYTRPIDGNEQLECLEFFNNSATSVGSANPGFIIVLSNCTFRYCIFNLNHFDYFLSGFNGLVGTASFSVCIFSESQLFATGRANLTTTQCSFQLTGILPLDVFHCGIAPTSSYATVHFTCFQAMYRIRNMITRYSLFIVMTLR